jgi:hypothetical protein
MKHNILLDTNILIYCLKYDELKKYIDSLSDNYNFFINQFIVYEMEVGLKTQKELDLWQKMKITLDILPTTITELQQLEIISTKYKKEYKNKKAPSIIDALLGALLFRFKGKLSILTANHKDFPSGMFTRSSDLFWIENTEDGRPIIIAKYDAK